MKPPLTYYGGKQVLAKQIISMIPKHILYVEPFFGGGAVFFTKPPSKSEMINDTNGELINFYKVMKNDFKKLEMKIQMTLHSRSLHSQANVVYRNPNLFTDVQRAWAVWVLANQGFASKLDGSWGYDKQENKTAHKLNEKRIVFKDYVKRLETTQIECSDALRVIKSLDAKDTFFYLDPPYFNSHQGHYKGYTKEDFEKLLVLLSSIKGKFLLSSYPSPLLIKYSKKNKWVTKKVNVPLCLASAPNVAKKRKIEILTVNYLI